VVSSGVHEQHAEKHNMASNTTSLGVVDFDGGDGSNLGYLDIDEAIEEKRLEWAIGIAKVDAGSTYLT
jgi:hypothetical protein